MKVSNGINVTRIYQEQLKKAQAKNNGDTFSKVLDSNSTKIENDGVSSNSALKQISTDDANPIVNGKAQEVDPVEAFKHAAEVFASSPEPIAREEKVSKIKALYDAGQYNVSASAVAEKLWATGIMSVSWEA